MKDDARITPEDLRRLEGIDPEQPILRANQGTYCFGESQDWFIPSFADTEASGFDDGSAAPSTCRTRECGAEIMWVVTRAGKRMPINRDGISHFATCPGADKWRKSR